MPGRPRLNNYHDEPREFYGRLLRLTMSRVILS